jgi:hypothetical protein
MARGWESKDIESQMEDARENRHNPAGQLTPQEMQIARERDSLLLQRTRVLADMRAATHARYREMLQRSLAFLDEKLAALDGRKPS